MGSRVWWLVVFLVGCRGIGGVRLDPQRPVAMTVVEVDRARAEGQKLAALQPRTLPAMAKAADLLVDVARAKPEDFEAQWQAAEALAFVAEYDTRKPKRVAAAKTGIALTRQAREAKPERVEGHYWYAVNVGLLADADRTYGLKAVGEMEAALKRAAEVDERYDCGGPLRLMAILHLRTPAPPVSVGSPRKGLRLLQRATELFPAYPENLLYLAEALRDNQRVDDARQCLEKLLNAPPWPSRLAEDEHWKSEGRKLLKCLPVQ